MRPQSRHRSGRRRKGFWARVGHVFRERQIYLRSEGEVQFVTLRPWVQITCLVVLFAGLFWLAFASINVTFKDQLLALKERRLYQARLDYEDRIATMRTAIDGMNNRLLLNQDEYLAKVDELRTEYEALVERHQRLNEFFQQGWMPAKAGGSGKSDPAAKPGDKEAGATGSKAGFDGQSYKQRFAQTFSTAKQADAPLEHLRTAMRGFEPMQVGLLDEVARRAETRIKGYGKLFAKLGLNAKQIAERSDFKPDSAGGPFISISAEDVGSKKIAESMSNATQRLVLLEKLKFEFARMPLYSPLDRVTRISSRYGLRRDPFRRRMAMHAGIDFKAPYGAPIRATSAGVVVKAGWEGAYGRLVEIRHDNGISTRYAHMSAVKVKRGQRVKRGAIVGRLGNTGRSTGAHLHYETRINGKAINPARFWKVRHAVQEISQ